jgi:acetyl esterase/lipase
MNVVLNHDLDGRPNFAAAIYGGETAGHPVPSDAPPLFAVVAQDDELGMAGKVVNLYSDWNAATIPAELHVFAKGGHGFGTIKQGLPVDHWLELFTDWLSAQQGH